MLPAVLWLEACSLYAGLPPALPRVCVLTAPPVQAATTQAPWSSTQVREGKFPPHLRFADRTCPRRGLPQEFEHCRRRRGSGATTAGGTGYVTYQGSSVKRVRRPDPPLWIGRTRQHSIDASPRFARPTTTTFATTGRNTSRPESRRHVFQTRLQPGPAKRMHSWTTSSKSARRRSLDDQRGGPRFYGLLRDH